MKLIKILLVFSLVIFTATSCEKALDINTNPLVASSADPNAVLPYVFVQYSNRHVTELGTRTMDVPQHLGFCFNSPRQGVTSSFLTGNTWFMYYNQVLGNLTLVEQDAAAAGVSSNNIAAIAKIMKAKSFFELTSLWGDIPYSEALDGVTYPSPKFDSQEDVLRGVVATLDEAMGLIDAIGDEVFDVSNGDMIYGGDMDAWRRWANSLKIRVLMLLRNKDTSVDSQLVAALSQPVIETNSQAALLRYLDTPGEANAWQRLIDAFFGGRNEDVGVYSPSTIPYNLLKDKEDPRFGVLIHDPNDAGGSDMGEAVFNAPGSKAHVSNNVIRNDLPHIMMLPSEISFYRAELALLGVTNDDAQAQFEAGLSSIIKFWGGDIPGATATISGDDIDNFIANYGTATLQDVHEQLYLESFMRPIIAWNTVRRTKVPEMNDVPGTSISSILKRFNYPPDEVASNINTPANLPTDTPVWFEN